MLTLNFLVVSSDLWQYSGPMRRELGSPGVWLHPLVMGMFTELVKNLATWGMGYDPISLRNGIGSYLIKVWDRILSHWGGGYDPISLRCGIGSYLTEVWHKILYLIEVWDRILSHWGVGYDPISLKCGIGSYLIQVWDRILSHWGVG